MLGDTLDRCTYTGEHRVMTTSTQCQNAKCVRDNGHAGSHMMGRDGGPGSFWWDGDYDTLHDSIPSDVPDTVWESDALSKGAGE